MARNVRRPIGEIFDEAVSDLVDDAKSLDVSTAEICEKAGTSRATLFRWRRKRPKSIVTLGKMQDTVSEIQEAQTLAKD